MIKVIVVEVQEQKLSHLRMKEFTVPSSTRNRKLSHKEKEVKVYVCLNIWIRLTVKQEKILMPILKLKKPIWKFATFASKLGLKA